MNDTRQWHVGGDDLAGGLVGGGYVTAGKRIEALKAARAALAAGHGGTNQDTLRHIRRTR